jgi:ribonuclease HI
MARVRVSTAMSRRRPATRGNPPHTNPASLVDIIEQSAGRRISAARRRVVWRWVRGHAGNAGNSRADALASFGARRATRTHSADLDRSAEGVGAQRVVDYGTGAERVQRGER